MENEVGDANSNVTAETMIASRSSLRYFCRTARLSFHEKRRMTRASSHPTSVYRSDVPGAHASLGLRSFVTGSTLPSASLLRGSATSEASSFSLFSRSSLRISLCCIFARACFFSRPPCDSLCRSCAKMRLLSFQKGTHLMRLGSDGNNDTIIVGDLSSDCRANFGGFSSLEAAKRHLTVLLATDNIIMRR